VIAVLALTGVNLSDSYEKIAGSIPNIGWFEKSISINNRSDSQGHIQWFIEGD
jgi:hypothetical protein